MKRRALVAAALLGALGWSARAHASPADAFGLGSRSTALGGAVSASCADFSANYYNPAGLVQAQGMQLSLGTMWAEHALEMNGRDSQVDPVHGLVGGLVAPGKLGSLPFAFGIAAHLSDERISRARTVRQDQPRWVLYDNRSQLLYLAVNGALRPLPWWSVGGGVAFLASTRGAFSVRGTAVLPNGTGQRSEFDSRLEHEVDADLTSVRYLQLGTTLHPSEDWAVSLAYRQSAKIALKIGAELRGTVDAQILQVPAYYALDSRTANAYLPEQWVLGAAYHPTPRWTLGADLQLVRWSGYESPVSRSSTVLEVEVPGNLVDIPASPKPSKVIAPGFSDRLVPRVGAEVRLPVATAVELPLRLGYALERSPVPAQTGLTNFVDADRHLLSAGAGVAWLRPGAWLPGALTLDLHSQLSLLPERVTLKQSPADYVGDYRARGWILNLGASLGVAFQ